MLKIVIILIILSLGVGGVYLYLSSQKKSEPALTGKPSSTQESISQPPAKINITASFEIYTLGTKRIFTDPKYHNQSSDVYIESSNPSLIKVKKAATTWGDFFATLPMKLSPECLTTGTGQVFCTNESRTLKFFVNDIEEPQALNQEILEGQKLIVRYE
jgi:hypothetical protein